MSKTTRTDGQWQVDCDINGVPICIGRPLSLPRYDVPTLDECRVIVAPLIEDIKRRPGAAARAKLEATAEGRALLAAAKAHLLECFGLTPAGVDAFMLPTACAMQVRPCRCGPDGCADSGCAARKP